MIVIAEVTQVDREVILKDVLELALRLGIFLLLVAVSPIAGRSLPQVLQRLLLSNRLYADIDSSETQTQLIKPFERMIATIGTLLMITISLNVLVIYEELYRFLGFFVYSALSISIIWFASKAVRLIVRRAVINLVKRWFGEVNEVVLIFETLIYFLIILLAIVIFAQGLRLNLVALATSLGIGGVAVAFASQQTLGRLFGTLELYLDRPYLPGEYIRVTFNPYAEETYGRVESIGLRSTKIRLVAQNTLMIVPNSLMASKNIENISRGKKIMAMLCLDFDKLLTEAEKALIRKIVGETSQVFWGFDKASTQIQFSPKENQVGIRVRILFFLTGSSENSVELRKRLLELANNEIANKLAAYNLRFTTCESIVYIDSPMSI